MGQNSNSISLCHDSGVISLHSATDYPKASGFLWNHSLLLQMNCRGYGVAQFMQPEPAKYARGPLLEAKTFIQPEHHYFSHHPGRFFYIKDRESGEFFSVPYEPVRHPQQRFQFSCTNHSFEWRIHCLGLEILLSATLSKDDIVELWQINVINGSDTPRSLSVYSYFPTGYMSWMNQGAEYDKQLQGIICRSITPYQKVDDYFKNKELNDLTYFISDTPATAWETRQISFEGEGGLHAPSGIKGSLLANGCCDYEVPTTVLQFDIDLSENTNKTIKSAFGPAKDKQQIEAIKARYLDSHDGMLAASIDYQNYLDISHTGWQQNTVDRDFDHLANFWLQRQLNYHGEVNRLSTDPQTRNYLQDAMGMIYLKPSLTRKALLTTISQQHRSGALPDGILIHPDAELKYINQVPHTDHNIWLPVVLSAYLKETNDYSILEQHLPYQDSAQTASVRQHVNQAMDYLWHGRDPRGLHYIEQGDWCDPMNMVGYKGIGVSSWLTLATSVAMQAWADILDSNGDIKQAKKYRDYATSCNQAVNSHCWDGDWYARGITDNGDCFGVSTDIEGRIFLNPQSWALLANAATSQQKQQLIAAIEEQLVTPYGTTMLAPAFTAMREDVGRVTQKYPGTAENGSVYNHAMAFYIYALYQHNESEKAYQQLRLMIPDIDSSTYRQRGQLPIFIPNYYRGAYHQKPDAAGRSSHLFNTGTCAWVARCIIEGLFGLQGSSGGLTIAPQLPVHWQDARINKVFRGADLTINFSRSQTVQNLTIDVDGIPQTTNTVSNLHPDRHYNIDVLIPEGTP